MSGAVVLDSTPIGLLTQRPGKSPTADAMRLAADLWAQARNGGWATADPHALDGDVILAAQALALTPAPTGFVVATGNVVHLSRYLPAREWAAIVP